MMLFNRFILFSNLVNKCLLLFRLNKEILFIKAYQNCHGLDYGWGMRTSLQMKYNHKLTKKERCNDAY